MVAYEFFKVKDVKSNGILNMVKAIHPMLSEARPAGYALYGVFFGLLGLASNELYLVTVRDQTGPAANTPSPWSTLLQDRNFSLPEQHLLFPTVRPVEHAMRTKEGIYVFRWFDVKNSDVDEIVQLSDEAWVPFEGGFDSEIQGLFAESDRSRKPGKMLLLTWYRNLGVWEASRRPSKEAKERFLKRHALTLETTAIATRLYIYKNPS
jgi:hypothetical protein